ncbi:hypothetical protein AAC387_Pa01g2425 [Persea americana]
MAFQGTDGFSVFDGQGRLVFRVDNYSRKNRCIAGGVVLMDGAGRALLTLRPQTLSLRDQWNGFKGDGGMGAKRGTPVFSMRRRSFLRINDETEVFMGGLRNRVQAPDFRITGSFRRRCCKIQDNAGEVVAEISRKRANAKILLSDDVFRLIVQPGYDCELMMAFVVTIDRIFGKPITPALCS